MFSGCLDSRFTFTFHIHGNFVKLSLQNQAPAILRFDKTSLFLLHQATFTKIPENICIQELEYATEEDLPGRLE
jgi:hypothetical protein